MHSCDQLLLDLGQTAGLPQPLRFDDQGCARLTVDSHLHIDFERDADADLIQLYSVLGPMPARDNEALYRQLLEANLFGLETAGATLSIDPDQREIVLCRTIRAEGTAAPAFVQLVERFIAAAEQWKERVAAHSSSAGPATASEATQPAAPDMSVFLRA